jgi:hypothetical protein
LRASQKNTASRIPISKAPICADPWIRHTHHRRYLSRTF